MSYAIQNDEVYKWPVLDLFARILLKPGTLPVRAHAYARGTCAHTDHLRSHAVIPCISIHDALLEDHGSCLRTRSFCWNSTAIAFGLGKMTTNILSCSSADSKPCCRALSSMRRIHQKFCVMMPFLHASLLQGLVIDGGSNLGYFTMWAAAMGHRVFSFEPMDFNLRYAYTRTRTNTCVQKQPCTNVYAHVLASTHAHAHVNSQAHAHVCTLTCILMPNRALTHKHAHPHLNATPRTSTPGYMCTLTHTYTHTHIHTHSCKHAHAYLLARSRTLRHTLILMHTHAHPCMQVGTRARTHAYTRAHL